MLLFFFKSISKKCKESYDKHCKHVFIACLLEKYLSCTWPGRDHIAQLVFLGSMNV